MFPNAGASRMSSFSDSIPRKQRTVSDTVLWLAKPSRVPQTSHIHFFHWFKSPRLSIYKISLVHSEWQCVHEDFIHNGWRWHQVFQFKIEDSLEALGAQCSQLRKLAQETGQVVGPGGLRGTCGDVVSETRDQAVLEVFDPFGLFQAVSICWSQSGSEICLG